MTEKLKYKAGDRILFEAIISEVDVDDTDAPYYLNFKDDDTGLWVDEEELETLADRLPPKHQVPQVAFEYYEFYKGKLTDFDEWFGDFFDREFRKEFGEDRAEELAKWLYDNDIQTNLERELALATLIVKGPEAVEIEKEKVYKVYVTVGGKSFSQLKQDSGSFFFGSNAHDSTTFKTTFTESELENMGLGEVFSCNIFKVEEVE